MYEGAPDWPQKDRFWEIIERYGVTIFYTAPTAIRAFMRWGTEWPAEHDLSTLRLLGLGRRADQPGSLDLVPPAHRRRPLPGRRHVVADRDRAIMITPLPGITTHQARARRRGRSPASAAEIRNDEGETRRTSAAACSRSRGRGRRCCAASTATPSATCSRYWSRWRPDVYFTGDGAKRDEDGYFWLLGRVDDVLNVAGHRIGTMEVESALVDHPNVAEAAVVGRTHEIKGQAIAAFVTLKGRLDGEPGARRGAARTHVVKKIGAIARPDDILFAADLPKTRRARSCGACCATSPRARRSATRRRWPIRPWWRG